MAMRNKANKRSQLKIQAGKNQRFLVPQSSKSQLKIQEMAFMLMAVVILFILAGLFFLVIKSQEMYKEANLRAKEKALSTVSRLAETAEFSCGKPSCVDTDKLIVMNSRTAYSGFWPVVSLEVIKIFPKQELVECTKENYPDCSLFKIYEKKTANKETVSTFVALCRKEKTETGGWYEPGKCELGKMVAGFEPKQPK